MKNKIVLAYSGGLDTSFCIPYLIHEKLYEVYAVSVNTGGFSVKEIQELERKAIGLGAKSFHCIDVEEEYYSKCIKYLIFGNILRNGTYPLSVSSERIFQAIKIAEYAQIIHANAVAHGSTGAGNDQVRFDLIFQSLVPELKIETPIRELGLTRYEEIKYLEKHAYQWNEEKGAYSINKGLWGTSVGGKETLGSLKAIPDHIFPSQLESTSPLHLSLQFHEGQIAGINEKEMKPIESIKLLNTLGAKYAIGRDYHTGDTIIGLKGRIAFEAPAAVMLIKAHELMEKHTLGKWQLYWKKQLSEWYGMMTHEAQFLDPVMRNIETFLENTQERVTGSVFLTLHPYRFTLEGIDSPFDLMNSKHGKYGEEQGAWSAEDAKGFIKLFGNANKIYHSINSKNQMV